jgi:hypothetical protein
VSDKRNELLAHIDAAPNEAKVEARQTREKIAALETSCKQHQAEAAATRARIAAQVEREKELKKLDFTSLQAGKWADYVKGLAEFSKERVGAPPEDLEARTAETRRRLGALEPKLTSWHETLPRDGTYNPATALAITNTEDQISALPAYFQGEKERLFKVITEIKSDLEIWEACSAFDKVNAIYMDISGNLGSRTEARKQDLNNALDGLRTKNNLKDHVSDGLDQIQSQLDNIMAIKVEKVQIEGTFPDNNDAVAMKWQFNDKSGTEAASSSMVDKERNFALDFLPGSNLPHSGSIEIFVTLSEFKWGNSFFAIRETTSRGELLTGATGLEHVKTNVGRLYQTRLEVELSEFSPLNSTASAPVQITLTLSGSKGPKITPLKCVTASNRSAANASDL